MAFDEYPHGASGWLKPSPTHPGSPASALPLSLGLGGAYGFALCSARQLGVLHYRWTWAGLTEVPPAVISASPVGVGQVEGYVPNWATRIVGEVSFALLSAEQGTAKCQIATASDTGPVVSVDIDSTGIGANLEQRLPRGQLYDFVVRRIRAAVDLSATTLDADVLIAARLAAVEANGITAVPIYPVSVSVWWE